MNLNGYAITNLFYNVGLGNVEIIKVENFRYSFAVPDNPVAKAYRLKGKKTCYITSDAIEEFFTKDLSLPSEVNETSCMNEGADKCMFTVSIQPLAVYKIALDALDREIIRDMRHNKNINEISKKLNIETEEMDYRLSVLKNYKIIDKEHRITEVGETYYMYMKNQSSIEEDFPAPWEDMQKITSAIAASESFAVAFESATFKEPMYEVDEEKVVNLSEEAKKSRSFAELLSKQINKEDDE
jgi:predicted transcriptional regulator